MENRKPRRKLSSQLKAQLVMEYIKGIKSQAEICRENALSSGLFAKWYRQFQENIHQVFEDTQNKVELTIININNQIILFWNPPLIFQFRVGKWGSSSVFLATFLAQGKPAIVYVPKKEKGDEDYEIFEERTKLFKDLHPLGLQVDLKTGVAHGVIVVREPEE